MPPHRTLSCGEPCGSVIGFDFLTVGVISIQMKSILATLESVAVDGNVFGMQEIQLSNLLGGNRETIIHVE
jgi:hypothetical protein